MLKTTAISTTVIVADRLILQIPNRRQLTTDWTAGPADFESANRPGTSQSHAWTPSREALLEEPCRMSKSVPATSASVASQVLSSEGRNSHLDGLPSIEQQERASYRKT